MATFYRKIISIRPGRIIPGILIVLILFFTIMPSCYAGVLSTETKSSIEKNKKTTSEEAGYDASTNQYSLAVFLGSAVKGFLSLLGIIFIILLLYGGYNWMTAGGDESKVETAKKTIQRAIIGLIITVSAYGFWVFIFVRLF